MRGKNSSEGKSEMPACPRCQSEYTAKHGRIQVARRNSRVEHGDANVSKRQPSE